MAPSWLKSSKKPIIFISALFLVSIWILYPAFGHQLVKAMYEGRSLGIFNRVIEWQNAYPVEAYYEKADKLFYRSLIFFSSLFLTILFIRFLPRILIVGPIGRKRLENHTDAIDAIPDSHIGLWIALAAGLSLYTELMIIRLHSSYFLLFAYFKNISLLSCFLGLGIGYARGSRRPLTTPLVLPFLALQIILMYVFRFSPIAKFLQSPIQEQIAFAMGTSSDFYHTLIACGFLIFIFSFNALCFIPLGQLASRLMLRREKLVSYSWNLIGSLVGILIFSFISFLWTPPSIWIIVAALATMVFLRKNIISLVPSVIAVLIVLGVLAIPFSVNQFDVYSPYQILTLTLSKIELPMLQASNTWHQVIIDLSKEAMQGDNKEKRSGGILNKVWYEYYTAPYYFKPTPEDVLIVGSGTGNDVAAAIRNGAVEIDAVEIDPAILQFGKQLHPESPYQARNVNVTVNDARAFIRHTHKRYDLIVYGVLDSLTLLSSKSGGIRLDSYVYTVEAFREARERLKEGGIISLTFGGGLNDELGHKIFLMLKEAFDGQDPIAYIASYGYGYTFLAGDGLDKHLLQQHPALKDVTATFADDSIRADKSTDDWPFFYMPVRKYPISFIVVMTLLLAISIAFIRQLLPGAGGGFSGPCFFLGAGFMLVETKGITELALVYGSTWFVISAVITAILIMAFLANLLVMKMGKAPPPLITYGLLFISLIAGLGLAFTPLISLTPWLSRIIMTAVLTLPLFFSGFAFSTELRKSVSVAVALSSNLLGAMLGGFLEYNSMYFGFRSLYFLALITYGLAFICSLKARQ